MSKRVIRVLHFIFFVVLYNNCYSQNTDQSQNTFIEGAKLTIDLIKTIKDKKVNSSSQVDKETNGFCVSNKSSVRLSVEIINKTSGDTTNLVVQARGSECSFSVNIGNCSYVIKDLNGNIYRKGDVIINESDQIQIEVE